MDKKTQDGVTAMHLACIKQGSLRCVSLGMAYMVTTGANRECVVLYWLPPVIILQINLA